MLSTAATEHPFDWEAHLRHLCMAYNSSRHTTTGYSPFYLMYGHQVRMPIDLLYGTPSHPETSPSEYATELQKKLESAYHRVRATMGQSLDRQKQFYDRKVHGKPYQVGDLVWLHSPAVPRGQYGEIRFGPRYNTMVQSASFEVPIVSARHPAPA